MMMLHSKIKVFIRPLCQIRKVSIIGYGSSSIDLISLVEELPKSGKTTYFQNPNSRVAETLVSGVGLTHMSWAALLGSSTAFLAPMGRDHWGRQIRSKMQKLGVSTEYSIDTKEHITSVNQVIIDRHGERVNILSPGSISSVDLNSHEMLKYIISMLKVSGASLFSTEIASIPFQRVDALLEAATDLGMTKCLDMKLSPNIAIEQALLGDKKTLLQCLSKCNVLKTTLPIAKDLLYILGEHPLESLDDSLNDITQLSQALCDRFNQRIVAITHDKGCAIATSDQPNLCASIESLTRVKQLDTTGADEAFFGAMLSVLSTQGFPNSMSSLVQLGSIANAAGAVCCETQGTFPDSKSLSRMHQLEPLTKPFFSKQALQRKMLEDPIHSTRVCSQPSQETSNCVTSGNEMDDLSPLVLESLNFDLKSIQDTLQHLAPPIFHEFKHFTHEILCATQERRQLFLTGIGKSGIVARRLSVSLCSVSVPSQWVHASEWCHGDLGQVRPGDCVVIFSNSGQTQEVLDMLRYWKLKSMRILSITANPNSTLAQESDYSINIPVENELLGCIPTRSIMIQEAISNALLTTLVSQNEFHRDAFLANHPGGSIGNST